MNILILEDSPEIQRLYQRIFRDDTVTIVSRPAEAIRHLRSHMPDLLILDIQLPQASGVDVLKYIRLKMKLVSLKILVVSGTVVTRKGEFAKYADDVLDKPFGMTELMYKITNLKNRSLITDHEAS